MAIFATRVHSFGQRLLVSVGLLNLGRTLSSPTPAQFSGVAYIAEENEGRLRWSEQTDWPQSSWSPLGQMVEFEGRPASLNRRIGGDERWDLGTVYPPELAVIPDELLWTVTAGPRLTSPELDSWFRIRGFGALGRRYQLLRSHSLSSPDWKTVSGPFYVESTGQFRFDDSDFDGAHFYKVEELP